MAREDFNLSTFISNINRRGLLSDNKYKVTIPLPRGLQNSAINLPNGLVIGETSRMLSLMCDSTEIPGVRLNTSQNQRYGYGVPETNPYNAMLIDTLLTFYVDGQGSIWSFFNTWQQLITNLDISQGINGSTGVINGQKPFELAYKEKYVVDMSVTVFDNMGNPKIQVKLLDSWPVAVGDVKLAWGSRNNLFKLPVWFSYRGIQNAS